MDEMKLFPFLGRSKNLIELFFIIGIDENILSEFEHENEMNLEITLISEIISDLAFENADIKDIISQVYPDKHNIYKETKNGKPNSTSVTFSYFFDSTFYSCYALKFYEKYKIREDNYFMPKAFVIISEYPYFKTFDIICSQLYKMNFCKQNLTKESYNNIEETKNNINNIPIEIFIYCLVNYIPSPLNKNLVLNIFPNIKISIPKLTGYPFIGFDICNLLFNKDKPVKIKNFIKVYILMFLEFDLLFFSPDHEKLNLIMCLLNNLIYPLTDSEYSKHIKSISKKELSNGFNVPYSTFRGVISNLDPELNLSSFRDLNFIVEVENRMETINLENEKRDTEEKNKLIIYIDKIFNYKNVHSSFLANYLTILRKELKNIRVEYKKYKSNNNSFLNINEEIIKFNKKVQEAFYNFNLNILKIFYHDFKLDTSNFVIKKNVEKQNDDFSEEESIFMKEFRNTTRYSKYYESFVGHFESIDELRFSYLFSDDLIINLKMNTNKFDNFNNYFDIMDKLYDNQNENENYKNYVIYYEYLFKDFEGFYQEKIKKIKKTKSKNQLFILDKKIINDFLFYKNNKEFFKSLKIKEKNEVDFKRIKKWYIPKIIEFHHIPEEINNKKINNEEIVNNNDEYWINCSFIFIFAIILPLFSHSNINIYLKDLLINTFKKIKYFQRFYIEILLKSIYYYYLYNEERGMFPDLTLENIKSYYNVILNELIIKYSILPNEEILFYLKKILHDDNKKKDIENGNEKKPRPEKNNFIFQYDKEIEEAKFMKQDSIIKKNDSLIFTYNEKEIKYKIIRKGKEIHSRIYLIYKELSTNNFELEKLDFKKTSKVIINVFDSPNSGELSLFLNKSMNVLKIFKKFVINKNNKK
jgi:hypothetical protein